MLCVENENPEAMDETAAEPGASRNKLRRQKPRRRRSRRRRVVMALLAVVTLLGILVIVSGVGYVAYRNHQIKKIAIKSLSPPAKAGPDVGVQTFLLIGSTSRCALPKQNPLFGTCATGITGINSDVIILLRADQKTHSISILSIPRDLVLYNVRPGDQFYKIDAALYDGPGQLVSVIEQDFGIPINHFAELNFDSFQNVVNALGGIKMYFPYPETDSYSNLDIKTPGCHALDGFEALAVVRARHLSYFVNGQWDYDGSGDLGRIIRVHEFLRVLASAMEAKGLDDPLTDNAILGAIAPQLTVDSKLSLTDMVNLVLTFHSVNPAAAPEETIPNIEDTQDYIFQGYDFGSVVLPSYPQDQEAIDQFEGISAPPGSSIDPKSVSVSVVNGTFTQGDEQLAASGLASLGYHIVGTSTSTPVGPISETIVYYSRGHLLDAARVVQSLGGIVSMAEGPTQDGADVSLVTGSNFSIVTPRRTKPRRSTGTTPTTTTTTVPPASTVLGPVSSAVQSLPAYDPRACPSS
jgi:LCP family protein required for cell wall assembly